MKKIITKPFTAIILFLGITSVLKAQCAFTGLSSSYCKNASAVTLVPSVSGGAFTGPGVTGSVFSPTLAGGGNHSITLTCPGNYTVSQGTFNWLIPSSINY